MGSRLEDQPFKNREQAKVKLENVHCLVTPVNISASYSLHWQSLVKLRTPPLA